jgi:hypothetical protein
MKERYPEIHDNLLARQKLFSVLGEISIKLAREYLKELSLSEQNDWLEKKYEAMINSQLTKGNGR